MLRSLGRQFSTRARAARGALFRERLGITPDTRILDLGGGDGGHLASIIPDHTNVTVADILPDDLARARDVYGFKTIQLSAESFGDLPLANGEYDVVFCSSVIEHVTGPKAEMIALDDQAEFRAKAWDVQRRFADELRRVAKRYFVQTPYRYFPIECHSWMPIFVDDLPRPTQRTLMRAVAPFWPADVQPDWNLLNRYQMARLFPDAEIEEEKALGFLKSMIAIR